MRGAKKSEKKITMTSVLQDSIKNTKHFGQHKHNIRTNKVDTDYLLELEAERHTTLKTNLKQQFFYKFNFNSTNRDHEDVASSF